MAYNCEARIKELEDHIVTLNETIHDLTTQEPPTSEGLRRTTGYVPDGNGGNRFWIEVKCEYEVYDHEWASILLLLNMLLKEHNNGVFSNVGAFLCEKGT